MVQVFCVASYSIPWRIYFLILLLCCIKNTYGQGRCYNLTYIQISQIQKPIVCLVSLKCPGTTQVSFQLSSNLMQIINDKQALMLRLDYQTNKCIFAKQDIALLPTLSNLNQTNTIQNQNVFSLSFNKTCCNLFSRQAYQIVKVVAVVRQAIILFGFPVSKSFIWSIIPIVIFVLLVVLCWIIVLRDSKAAYQIEQKEKQQ